MTLSVPDKAKVNDKSYVETITENNEQCKSPQPSGFISQQDGGAAHMAKLAQDWIATNCIEFIGKEE